MAGRTKSGNELEVEGSHHRNEPQSPEWIIEIEKRLNQGHTYNSGRNWTIYRVPNNLREVQRNAFLPKIISIGPFHWGDREERPLLQVMDGHNKRFLDMDGHKKRFLECLLRGKSVRRRTTTEGERESNDRYREEDDDNGQMAKDVRLSDLAEAMKELEQWTRDRYSESFDHIGSDDFVQMMVVDGCFVIELLRLYYDHVHTKSHGAANLDDPIFTTPWMLRTLQRDLLMLENQLPFFVLKKLFGLINCDNIVNVSLEVLVVTFFDPLLPRENAASKLNTKKPYAHLLDVFRSTFLKTVRQKNEKKEMDRITSQLKEDSSVSTLVRERQLVHFVLELQEAGVRFKRRKKRHDLLDIGFTRGTLRIPPLSIDDNTVPLFLNFVAYEQCDYSAKPFFTNYFMFWDSLVNSPGDIQVLHKHGIVNHVLGSNVAVANLLNKLCREIVYDLDRCYLYNEIKEMNAYCKPYDESKCRVWWRNLIRERFSSPWTCLSLFAAIFLLVLTVLQTVYAVYAYYRPH